MRLTHLGHACLLVEMAGTTVLIDPGGFSPGFTGLTGIDAVLITHAHPDHVDVDRLPGLLRDNPRAEVHTDPGTRDLLAGHGIDVRAHDGSAVEVGAVRVTPVGQTHALIHEEIPRIPNVGVRLEAHGEPVLFHPGDALDGEPGDVDVLAWPLSAPWAASRDMTAFLRRLDAPHAVPIHDGLLNPTGRSLYLGQADQLGGEHTTIHDLGDGHPEEFTR